jgi:hypothetical protein
MQPQAAAYTLTVAADHGSVMVTPDKAQYGEGEVVKLIPRPDVGYSFGNWSGDLCGTCLVGHVTMNSSKSITAHFGTWKAPIGIPAPEFGIFETYRMYDDPANRNPDLTYTASAQGGFYTHYVDTTNPNATDSSNSYGTLDKPRKTVPWNLPFGSVVEVHGGPYNYGTPTGRYKWTWFSGTGTQNQPVFIRGSGSPSPRFDTMEIRTGGSYVIMEAMDFNDTLTMVHKEKVSDHIVWRNVEVRDGSPRFADAVSAAAGTHVVIYGCYIHNNGDPDWPEENDYHATAAGAYARHVWILDNHMHGNAGDSVQIESRAIPLDEVARYIYIGRNVMHEEGENAVDLKQCADVIVSGNEMFGFDPTMFAYGGSDGTAMVVNNDYPHENIWVIDNDIYKSIKAVRALDSTYVIGNRIRDIYVDSEGLGGYGVGTYCTSLYVIGNTMYNVDAGVIHTGSGSGEDLAICNNIISLSRDGLYHVHLSSGMSAVATVTHNVFDSGTGLALINWNGQQSQWDLATFQATTGKGEYCLEGDPLFVDSSADDFRLQATSPAIDAGTGSGVVAGVFARFEELYGIDIRQDIAGRARPQGSGWDIGAFEYVLESIEDLAGSGGSQNSVTVGWTIPGADGSSDRPGRYDIRYATSAITEANWDSATQAQGEPEPADVGDSQSFTIGGLNPGTTYYIGIKTSNTGGTTISDLSNVASAATTSSGNRAPVFQTIGDKAVAESATLTFTVGASDADGDTLTYSASGVPTGASFTPATRVFTWTPTNTQGGTHWVTFGVTDGQIPVTQTIAITVAEVVNNAPVLAAIGNKNVNEGSLLSFSVSATDSDGDSLTYSATGLPSGANFTGQTFTWVPTYEQAGTYSVTFTVTDGELTDSEPITITVANVTPDLTAPTAAASYPAADAIQVPVNPVIGLTVSDAGQGVDAGTVTIRVNDQLVYSGNAASYQSVYGVCRRTGTQASYRYAYQPAEAFRFDQQVSVRVTASDLAGNAMTPYNCSFTTEMRVFGDNRPASWAPDDADKTSPATVCDSAGNIWLAYHAGAAGQRDIYVSKLTLGNANFAGPIQLTTDGSDQCSPAIAIGSDDTLYVVWQDRRRGNWDIYIRTSADGLTWSAETRITDSDDNQIRPAIAVDSQSPNRACVAWQDDGAGNQDIYVATSSNAFSTKTTSQVTTNASDQTDPAIAVDASNTVYLVWTDGRNGTNDVYGAASNSGPWTNVPVATGAGSQSAPVIATESAGTVLHFAWVDDGGADATIRYASSDGMPGSPLAGANIVDDTSGADQMAPAIATAGSAGDNLRVFLCWTDERNVNANGRDTDLYFVDVSAGQGTNVLVGDGGTGSDQSDPAVGVDRYGYPYVLWTDSRNVTKYVYYAGSTYLAPELLESELVTASTGRTVGVATPTSLDDVSVVIPAGACPYDVTINIARLLNPQSILSSNVLAFDFGPSGLQFSQPVTVTIPYPAADYSGGTPVPCWYVSQTGTLSQQDITNIQVLDLSDTLKALRFRTTHFTPYYLLESFVDEDGDGTWDGDDGGSSGGGGGGGGGCSLSHASRESVIAFLLPYAALTIYMILLRRRDRRHLSSGQ